MGDAGRRGFPGKQEGQEALGTLPLDADDFLADEAIDRLLPVRLVTGEQRLLAGLLDDAIRMALRGRGHKPDYRRPPILIHPERATPTPAERALGWIFPPDDAPRGRGFTFYAVCEHLDLDPGHLRQLIRERLGLDTPRPQYQKALLKSSRQAA